jgi:hypothetical protein
MQKPNEVRGRLPGHSWHGPIGVAQYCPHCETAGLITIDLGSHVLLTTTTCYKDAKTKIGLTQFDSHVEVAENGTQVSATDGELEVIQCTPSHIRAEVWASWPDGGRVDASIDTYFAQGQPTP